MEEEDEGPFLVGRRGVGWGEGDVVVVAEGGVGSALGEEVECDMFCLGVGVSGVFWGGGGG